MKVQADVPFSIEEFTPEWLSNSLDAAGVLQGVTVTDLNLQLLGEQVGYNGEVALLEPTYSSADTPAPRTMVLKIPVSSINRITGQTMGLYEKEIRFYRDLAPTLRIRTPDHYCSALDQADDPDVILQRLEGMNRLPIWTIRLIMALASRLADSHPRRYALVIEDLSGCRMGNQEDGCSEQDLEQVIKTMARLHAQFWKDDALAKMTWIAPFAATSRFMHMRYLQGIRRYLKEEASRLDAHQREVLEWLRSNGIALTERFAEQPPTLLHGDFRLDNIAFDDAKGEVILFDWQTMIAGPAASDLAYFISATLPEEADEAEVNRLLSLYQQALEVEGITLTTAHLRWQYEVGMVTMLHRLLPTTFPGMMAEDSGRGLDALRAWLQRIYARVAVIRIDDLLQPPATPE